MNITLRKFQEGGPVEAPEQAPEQGGGQDPLMQLAQLAAQAIQG
jgi:hypothetical protein